MKDFLISVVFYPVFIGAIVGIVYLLARDWAYVSIATWALGMGLSFGIWFPFVLTPYLKRKSSR